MKSVPSALIPNSAKIIRSSSKALTITSSNFLDLRRQINEIYTMRAELTKRLRVLNWKFWSLQLLHILSYGFIFGFFYKKIATAKNAAAESIRKLEKQKAEAYVKISFADDSQLEKSWLNCVDAFSELMNSEKIWDMTYSERVNKVQERSIAENTFKRTQTQREAKEVEFIKSDLSPLSFPNANGPKIFIFPTFLLFLKNQRELGIFDLQEIQSAFELINFIEEESVPKDTEIVSYTWKKANKDGSLDKRFKANYQIPIVKYGKLILRSEGGLEEAYMFSDFSAFSIFSEACHYHLHLLDT